MGRESGGISFKVYRLLFLQDGGNGFEGHTEIDVLTIRDATLYAATVVADGCNTTVSRTEYIVLL